MSLAFSLVTAVVPSAQAAPEILEGHWTIISREGGLEWVHNGVLLVKSAEGPSATVAPNHASTETYCVPAGLRWPQIISTSPAKNADWLVLPMSDTQFTGTVDCGAGTPVRFDNPTVRTFSFDPCNPSGSDICPAATGTGTASASSSPVIGLKPGVYHAVAHREGGGSRSTGMADVYVRPTSTTGVYVETWCYDGNFLWPRVTQTQSGVTFERTWWEFSVDSSTAPQNITCSSPKTNRADYTYHAD